MRSKEMKSIRGRLIATLLTSLTILLGAGDLGIYYLTRAVLTRDFDTTLRATIPEAATRLREQYEQRLTADRLLPFPRRQAPVPREATDQRNLPPAASGESASASGPPRRNLGRPDCGLPVR